MVLDQAKAAVNTGINRLHHAMRFPTFSSTVHARALSKRDYARYSTMALALERIRDERVEGDLAEIGVWRGATSVLLHEARPDRRLFLFDTFSGFPSSDLDPQTEDESRFRDTTVDSVAARFRGASGVRIVPGHVPTSLAAADNERFAFVLLDLDLYKPTIESLRFFYPRLSPGAFMFVHDYNNAESGWACKRALDGFLEGHPERVVEIGDIYGTAVFRKH